MQFPVVNNGSASPFDSHNMWVIQFFLSVVLRWNKLRWLKIEIVYFLLYLFILSEHVYVVDTWVQIRSKVGKQKPLSFYSVIPDE